MYSLLKPGAFGAGVSEIGDSRACATPCQRHDMLLIEPTLPHVGRLDASSPSSFVEQALGSLVDC